MAAPTHRMRGNTSPEASSLEDGTLILSLGSRLPGESSCRNVLASLPPNDAIFDCRTHCESFVEGVVDTPSGVARGVGVYRRYRRLDGFPGYRSGLQ